MTTALLIAAIVSAPSLWRDYADAYREWQSGRTLVVLVGADWCEPCRKAAPRIEQLARDGKLGDMVITKVDVDSQAETVRALGLIGGTVPKIVVFGKRLRVVFSDFDERRLIEAVEGMR